MQATDILRSEHRIIEQVLVALEGMAVLAEQQGRLDTGAAEQAIEFIRNFADKFHHSKEEDLLFVALEATGFPRGVGPVAVMLREHDIGRIHVQQMAQATEAYARGDNAAARIFAEHAAQFAKLLQGHIHREDHVLYPMADEALGYQRQRALLAGFARLDEKHGGEAGRSRSADVASALSRAYAKHAPPPVH